MFNTRIKVFQSDGGSEFDNKSMLSHFTNSGISLRKSCPNTPQQNRVGNRKRQHIIEMVRIFITYATLPFQIFVDAAFYVVFTINRLPKPVLHGLSPFEKLFHRIFDYNFLRVFGYECFPNLSAQVSHNSYTSFG